MTTIQDVADAHHAIARAERHYREVLRAALDAGVTQTAIAKQLGVTREKLRQDAKTDAERDTIRQADAQRKAELRRRARQTPSE